MYQHREFYVTLVIEYSGQLEEYLKENKVESFDCLPDNEPKMIGRGGYAIVYSVTFKGKSTH